MLEYIDMVIRFLSAIVAGLAIGMVLSEALIAGAGLLLPEFSLSGLIIGEFTSDQNAAGVLVVVYGLAATLSATMAAAVAGRLAGQLCGMLWLAPIFLLGSLSAMSDLLWASLAIACLIGALAGTRVALLIEHS